MRSHNKFEPDQFSRFDVYWIPTERQTSKEYIIVLKFGDGDEPNLCRVKKVNDNSTFIENIFRSGLTLVSSNDNNHKKINKQKRFKNRNLAVKGT